MCKFQLSIALFSTLLLAGSNAALAQTSTPQATVASFYTFDRAHSQIFNRRNLDARKGWLSDSLYALFINELNREREFLKENPHDKPYFGDGMPFRPLDETCKARKQVFHKAHNVGAVAINGNNATVKVRFAFPPVCKHLDEIYISVKLVKTSVGWRLDDLIYDDGSSLTGDMKQHSY